MWIDYIKLFLLYVLFVQVYLHQKKNDTCTIIITSALFTFLVYLIVPTIKVYKEGYEDYKIKVNGVSHLVKLLKQLLEEQEIEKSSKK